MLAVLAIETAPRPATRTEQGSAQPVVGLHYLILGIHVLPAGLRLVAIGRIRFVPAWRNKYREMRRCAGSRLRVHDQHRDRVRGRRLRGVLLDGFCAQVAFYVLTAAWLRSLLQSVRTIDAVGAPRTPGSGRHDEWEG